VNWGRCAAICGALCLSTSLSACTSSAPSTLSFSKVPTAILKVGTYASDRISVTDPKATILESGQLPAGVTFAVGADGTATLAGMPEAGSGGQYPIIFSADDAGGTISKPVVLTVEQAPRFPSLNNGTFVAKIFSHDKTLILTTGYPAAIISYKGTLPSSFSFTASANGTATITAAPGMFETPCDSQITVMASNAAGSASFLLLLKIASVLCPCNIVCSAFERNPVLLGNAIFQGGKFVGEKIFKGSEDIGETVERDGDEVAVDCEEECGQVSEDDGGD
jgi:hypothetical protein